MAAHTDDFDDLAQYALRVAGRDRSWMEYALCRPGKSAVPGEFFRVGERESVQIVTESDGAMKVVTVRGAEAQEQAQEVCRGCPVQWECARWAVEVGEEVGVWSVRSRLLRLLQRLPNALAVIDVARMDNKTMFEVVYPLWIEERRNLGQQAG